MDKKNKKKYLINILIILIVGGGSIYFSIGSQLESTIISLRNANYAWLIVLFGLMLLNYCVTAANLTVFARVYKQDYKFKQGWVNAMSGIFFSGITPMSTGGQFYQVYAFNKQGINATHSSSILLMVFIVYQSVLVLFTTIIVIFRYTYYSSLYSGFFSLALLGFVINLSVIAFLYLGAKSKTVQHFVCNNVVYLLAKIHIVKNYEDTKISIQRKLSDFRIELAELQRNLPVLYKSIALNFIKLVLLYSMPFFTAKAMNVPLDMGLFFDFIGITSFIYMISDFVPLPGASGGSEGTFYFLLNTFLKGATSATLLIWRFVTYYFGLILGGLVMSISKELNTSTQVVQEGDNEIPVEELEVEEIHEVK